MGLFLVAKKMRDNSPKFSFKLIGSKSPKFSFKLVGSKSPKFSFKLIGSKVPSSHLSWLVVRVPSSVSKIYEYHINIGYKRKFTPSQVFGYSFSP